jgi:hypothetical protein
MLINPPPKNTRDGTKERERRDKRRLPNCESPKAAPYRDAALDFFFLM